MQINIQHRITIIEGIVVIVVVVIAFSALIRKATRNQHLVPIRMHPIVINQFEIDMPRV